jgi:hypothetical protein
MPPRNSPRRMAAAALVVFVVATIAAVLISRPSQGGEGFNPSFQIGSWDPAYSAPLSDPRSPRSRLFRGHRGPAGPGPAGWSNPLVSAAFRASPQRAGFGGEPRHADPFWFARPMSRYRWRNTPYFLNGPTPSYYGSHPYPANPQAAWW